jgi:hypothetical protein
MSLTFLNFQRIAEMAGVESITFTAGKNRLIVLRGHNVEVTHPWKDDDEDFEDSCTRALREFSKVRLGWSLRNPAEEGVA